MSTIIVLPTYNEADNLDAMATALLALPLRLSLLIVDDNSPDGTGRIADRLAEASPGRVEVIHRPGKGGLGRAYKAGFQRALAAGAESIVQMDCDFSHSPHYLPTMIAQLAEYEVVVGSRYVPGGELDERWSWWRESLSAGANAYARAVLGLRVRDATAGFKAWRREALEHINLSRVLSNGYIFQVEMAYLSQRLGFRVQEFPIYFEDRRIGKSKMDIPVKIEAMYRVLELRWRHRKLESRAILHSR